MEIRLDRDTVSRYLSWARAALASICLLFQFIVAPVDSVLVTLSVGLYAAASWLIVVRKRTVRRTFELLTLFIDTVFFLVLAKYGAAQTVWLAPAFYLYLIGAAVSLYGGAHGEYPCTQGSGNADKTFTAHQRNLQRMSAVNNRH